MKPAPKHSYDDDPAAIAAYWVDHLTDRAPSRDDISRLRAWLDADTSHRYAYERARAIWTDLPVANRQRAGSVLKLAGGTALAACLSLVLVLAFNSHDLETRHGEIRRVDLADGSKLWLDSDSAVDLAFDETSRTIRLVKGRMSVSVAKESGRPFTVEADGTRITDIGTSFSVDRAEGVHVAVAQGMVDVQRGPRTIRLVAGEAGSFGRMPARLRPIATGDFAWRDGRIQLDQMSLDQALKELNRYFPGRIVLLNQSVGARRVSGVLFAGRVEEGVAALARSEGLRVTRLPWLILIGGKQDSSVR